MYKSINIDAAVEHVKNIVDNIRCAVCDKTRGTRMRYACGHTSCDECVVLSADCSVCLTPPQNFATEPVTDIPFTRRAENSVNLLNVFENEFHVDVYKRQRISEQLKVEKELFPECIQAPVKYFNKRKSFYNTKSNKENKLSQLPGEEISSVWDHKMQHQSDNVENWLNQYVRKPFADLNSNDERLSKKSSTIKIQNNIKDNENLTIQNSTRKRPYIKTTLSHVINQSQIDKHTTPAKQKKNHKKLKIEYESCAKFDTSKDLKTGNNTKDTDKHESGIVTDDEAVIIIDDSQSIRIDKDMNAWLAVLEAEKNQQSVSTSETSGLLPQIKIGEAIDTKTECANKVPFYLMSYLSDKCRDCNESYSESKSYLVGSTKDVSITVENKNFTTIIKVTSIGNSKNKVNSKQSVEVQTDISETMMDNENNMNKELDIELLNLPSACNTQSQDLFKNDGDALGKVNNNGDKIINLKPDNKTQNVIIEDSDSDGDLEGSVSLEVTAEIHRSCEEIDYGVLADVENMNEHIKRRRRAARGLTPTSTDSSDKENYNPNRKKKPLSSKKKPMKK